MRPTSSEGSSKANRFRLIVIGVIIIAIVAGIIVTLNSVSFDDGEDSSSSEKPYFSKAELVKSDIVSGDNTLIILEVTNPSSEFYEKVEIKLSTDYSKIEMRPTNRNIEYISENANGSADGTGHSIVISTPLGLAEHESTRTYSFEITGSLSSGTISSTHRVEATVLMDDQKMDNRAFKLTISSKD